MDFNAGLKEVNNEELKIADNQLYLNERMTKKDFA
jgi:hypothetical protein